MDRSTKRERERVILGRSGIWRENQEDREMERWERKKWIDAGGEMGKKDGERIRDREGERDGRIERWRRETERWGPWVEREVEKQRDVER